MADQDADVDMLDRIFSADWSLGLPEPLLTPALAEPTAVAADAAGFAGTCGQSPEPLSTPALAEPTAVAAAGVTGARRRGRPRGSQLWRAIVAREAVGGEVAPGAVGFVGKRPRSRAEQLAAARAAKKRKAEEVAKKGPAGQCNSNSQLAAAVASCLWSGSITTTLSAADACGLSRRSFSQLPLALASRLLTYEREAFSGLVEEAEERCRTGGWRPVLYTHWRMYDETPQMLRIPPAETTGSKVSAETAKVLAAVRRFAMLFEVGRPRAEPAAGFGDPSAALAADQPGDAPGRQQWVLITGNLGSKLLAMEDQTAEVLAQAVREIGFHDPDTRQRLESLFAPPALLVSCATSDLHRSNVRTERCLRLELPLWLPLYFRCEMHRVHTAQVRTVAVSASIESAILNTTLAFHAPGVLNRFRRALCEYIQENVDVVHAPRLSLIHI
jgi:hypothetical protein